MKDGAMPTADSGKELLGFQVRCRDPGGNRIARRFRHLELHGLLGLLLQNDRAGSYPTALDDIVDAECNKVTAAGQVFSLLEVRERDAGLFGLAAGA